MTDQSFSSDSPSPTPAHNTSVQLTPLSDGSQITLNQAADLMLRDLDLSNLTKTTYRHGANALLRHLHVRDGNDAAADALAPYPIQQLANDSLATFARWLREAYPDPRARPGDEATTQTTRTSRTYMVAARRLMNWLDLHDLLPAGVSYERMVREIDAGRGQRRQGYVQRRTDPEVVRVLSYYLRQPLPAAPATGRLIVLRNRLLMAMLYDTGMRISEALALSREDVLDGRARKVRLVRTKNGKPRTVFLSEDTKRLIHDYVRERTDGVYAPLFATHGRGKSGPGRRDAAISPAYAWRLVKDAAKAEGLYENTSPHSLRHRRAQDLLDEGMPLEWVAALLGHQHPDTTRVVYAWETDENRLAGMVQEYGHALSDLVPIEPSTSEDNTGGDRQKLSE